MLAESSITVLWDRTAHFTKAKEAKMYYALVAVVAFFAGAYLASKYRDSER